MRIACVAGFFNPVKTSIDKQFAKQVAEHSVVWVPQIPSGAFDLKILKQTLFDAVGKGATDILIIVFILRGREYQRGIVDSFVTEARRRSPGIRVDANFAFKDAQDGAGAVVKLLKEFAPKIEKQYPGDLSQLSLWITSNHSETIILHPRAERGANKSQFEDVTLIYQAIEVLASQYYAMRMTTVEEAEARRSACNRRLQELGLELAPSISMSRAGEEGDEYKIIYPIGGDKKCLMDLHLKKGSDRDERYCLRIYFFWDNDAKKVIIGWLTSHLDTRAS